MYNAPAKVTSNWFVAKYRIYPTMLGTTANIFGNLLRFLLPKLFINPKFETL